MAASTIHIDYSYADSSSVTQEQVIGGVANDGTYEGVEVLRAAQTELGLRPKLLIAPGWTHQHEDLTIRNPVAVALNVLAQKFKGISIADLPNTSDEDAVKARLLWGERRNWLVDPMGGMRLDGETEWYPTSAIAAAVTVATDAAESFASSPSNRLIAGINTTARPIEFALDDPSSRANYLNSNEITTIINEQGFRLWGGRTTSSDPKFAMINVQRTSDMIQESILHAHLWAVDKGITKGFVDAIVTSVQNYLRELKQRGMILGGDAWADPDKNTPDVIEKQQLFISYEFTPVYTAERLTFLAHLNNNYVSDVFD